MKYCVLLRGCACMTSAITLINDIPFLRYHCDLNNICYIAARMCLQDIRDTSRGYHCVTSVINLADFLEAHSRANQSSILNVRAASCDTSLVSSLTLVQSRTGRDSAHQMNFILPTFRSARTRLLSRASLFKCLEDSIFMSQTMEGSV